MALECGKPPVNDPPDQFKVYPEIFVDEHIPQCDDASPGNLRVLLLDEIRRQVSCRLANDLQVTNNGVLDHRVCKKSLAPFSGIQFDLRKSVANVFQVDRFVLHRGCASFRIRSRR